MNRMPNCQNRDELPLCGPLQGVLNLSGEPIRIEGWFEQLGLWATIVPEVAPASTHQPFAGALWLPKQTIIRSVQISDGTPLTTFGAVGNGISALQPSVDLSLAAPTEKTAK